MRREHTKRDEERLKRVGEGGQRDGQVLGGRRHALEVHTGADPS